MTKIVSVISGTGGAGKTFLCSNLATTIADRGNKVVVIDLDMNLKNLDMYLGLESKVVFNVMDVLDGVCRVRQALIRDKRFEHLYLIAGTSFYDNRVANINNFHSLINILKEFYDYIIIDTTTGKGLSVDLASSVSDYNILILEPSASSLRNSEIMIDYLRKNGNGNTLYTINKVNIKLINDRVVPTLNEISERINVELLGIIQYDENIIISNNFGEPITLRKDSYIAKNFQTIIERLI